MAQTKIVIDLRRTLGTFNWDTTRNTGILNFPDGTSTQPVTVNTEEEFIEFITSSDHAVAVYGHHREKFESLVEVMVRYSTFHGPLTSDMIHAMDETQLENIIKDILNYVDTKSTKDEVARRLVIPMAIVDRAFYYDDLAKTDNMIVMLKRIDERIKHKFDNLNYSIIGVLIDKINSLPYLGSKEE